MAPVFLVGVVYATDTSFWRNLHHLSYFGSPNCERHELKPPMKVNFEGGDLTSDAGLHLTIALAAATNNVTWSSNDEAVSTVDANCLITALAPRTATITATIEDGGKTASAVVIVSGNSSMLHLL